ncbi:MAG TPA: ABC transporter permease [Thermoanaerobaculia bacterium]|nr:ABC transporter permease [Thermoanaerobaculia bacterium]
MTTWLRVLASRVRGLWLGRRLAQELDAELREHLALLTDRYVRQGMTPEEAFRAARRQFGSVTRLQESCREQRGLPAVETLFRDLRYALRGFRRSPGFALVAVATLALAIGASTAIFSVVNGLLFQPLPFPAADRLMQLQRTFPDGSAITAPVRQFLYWRDHSRTFERVAAYDNLSLSSGFNMAGEGRPERVIGSRVSQDFLSVFAVQPALGRDFLRAEDRPGKRRVVILSHALWSRRFGADSTVLGRPIRLNGEDYTVVGVMPALFDFPPRAELWTPVQIDPTTHDKADYLEVTGRLRRGATQAQAAAEMVGLARQFAAAERTLVDNPKESVTVVPLRQRLYGRIEPQLLVFLGVVGCVLLVACANIGNLQLARSAARARELAVRTALGAGSRRLAAQLLTESLMLALIGGSAGLLLASWTLKPLLALSPIEIHPLVPIHVDATVLAFTFGVALFSGVLFGLLPALQGARPRLNEALQEGSARSTGGVRMGRLRRVLVVAQVAFALMPIILAIQLVKSFAGLIRTDPGFAADHVLISKLSLPAAKYGEPAAFERFSRQVREQVEAIPGVRSAVFSMTVPTEEGPAMPFTIGGRYQGKGSRVGVGRAEYRAVDPGFFRALRVPVVRGRLFGERDGRPGELVALVNETSARRFWPDEDPVGKLITVGQPEVPELADSTPRTVVGVVKDVRELGVRYAPPAVIYVPLAQVPAPLQRLFISVAPMSLLVRSAGNPRSLPTAIERAVWTADPDQPVTDIAQMSEVVSRSLGNERFATLLLGLLAAVVLTLAAVGIYGVLSQLVGQRTREIGVRMAFGATASRVLWLVIRQAIGPVLVGVALGLAAAYTLALLLAHLLFGVSPKDPLTFVVGSALMVGVALLASSMPAWRASRLRPVESLREG